MHRYFHFLAAFALQAIVAHGIESRENKPSVSLHESLMPTAITPSSAGTVNISGEAQGGIVRVRVTTSLGDTYRTEAKVTSGRFTCQFPQDFSGGAKLLPMVLYVDATDVADFGGEDALLHQAEATLIVSGGNHALPDLPLVFTDDFIDEQGRKDRQAAQWLRQRSLVNLFMRSRAAQLMHIQKPGFDLERPQDFHWFKEHASLYDFDHRDRDWTKPLGNRIARGFWQAVWNAWFNPSNDHPWDGNESNHDPKNYRPYTFTNDPADILVLYRMLQSAKPVIADNRRKLADEVLANLLALQHRSADNYALLEASGKQEHYTSGAFRYGMFETGEWMSEGNGWFHNPKFRDFAWGGVFNGRAVWALGECLKANSQPKAAGPIRDAIALAVRFCLHDGFVHQYTQRTKSGLPVWNRVAGEHAYLLLGMLAACAVAPEMPVQLSDERPMRNVTIDALNSLAESAGADGNWTRYANATAMNIAALAEGVRTFPSHKDAPIWKAAAMRAADYWLALKPVPSERIQPTPMFGHMIKDGLMTFILGQNEHPHVSLYIGGHWIHALAVLHSVTNETRYADRAHAILSYYCGVNPLNLRLLNEIGAVNNRLTDLDDDGTEDHIGWDGYPESMAFVQIGLLHLLSN